jgi:hypothetical protein
VCVSIAYPADIDTPGYARETAGKVRCVALLAWRAANHGHAALGVVPSATAIPPQWLQSAAAAAVAAAAAAAAVALGDGQAVRGRAAAVS